MTRLITVAMLCVMMAGCGGKSVGLRLDEAGRIMETAPDSALLILEGISGDELRGDELKARYALLKSMALDKNYIDATDFDILQPAMEYLANHGTPDEKMRTLYYQGRVYQNRGEPDEALSSFAEALSVKSVTDSLTLARAYIARAVIYLDAYNPEALAESASRAAEIYGRLGDKDRQLDALARALTGRVILKEKARADSLVAEMRRVAGSDSDLRSRMWPDIANFMVAFGTDAELKALLREAESRQGVLSDLEKLNIAECYLRLGNSDEALRWLDATDGNDGSVSPLGYLASKVAILESNGKYKEALKAHTAFADSIEGRELATFERNQRLNEKRHRLEIAALESAARRQTTLLGALGAGALALALIIWLYGRSRIARSRREIAERERDNARLELETKRLEAENLAARIDHLESESAALKNILNEREQLSAPIEAAIRERIELLNALLARDLTANEGYAKPYNEWVNRMTNDRETFMNSTRLAFKASHPRFIEYLEERGLSDSEINYLCLYAIGLRGKEVGEYIRLKRHYNISSAIRRKLGIDEHETNIGIYARRLMKLM
ncbi:MAG: hypothetical protein NC210_08240 [[Clostridium] fimetarium]|nr:hypothetical protein [Alistipes timonensis]MCM1406394.1 hypothetical protein [[Clostridium] fimetarium]